MKSVLISIQPKWCELIANGKKTVEVRKTKPKLETPFKVYIYCTQTKTMGDFILCKSVENAKLFGFNTAKGINKGFAKKEDIQLKGKIIGEFVCDEIIVAECGNYCNISSKEACLTAWEMLDYADEKTVYGWHISDLVIYDKPRELSEFWSADKCPYASKDGCTYKYHCFRSGQTKRCGDTLTRPPQSWCYVESEVEGE